MDHLQRETISEADLAICLSHYDLGEVRTVRQYPRGSRRSPKVVIESQKGRYLFKARARGKDDPAKVAFTHTLQNFLAARNFPLPHLIGTRDTNSSMLVHDGRTYEMFEYIEAGMYDGQLDSTYDAGRILGLFHKLVRDFQSDYLPPRGSYHGAKPVQDAIRGTVGSLPVEGRPSQEELMATVAFLEQAYAQSWAAANEIGLADWHGQIVHGDWHPGNMLFRDHKVAAVIDYDSARMYQRVIDLANGALQFSIIGSRDNPANWPDQMDLSRLKRFVRGYDSVNVISRGELEAIPPLMCEAMIAESVLPIAATGSFGRMEGFPFLQMIQRKVRWVQENQKALQSILID
jgi:Ser/Thr protein kinase RdoA (MazF antagonist)